MSEEIKKQWSEETLEAVDKLCLFDDDFMSLVFDRNIEATEYLLNTIFERSDRKEGSTPIFAEIGKHA